MKRFLPIFFVLILNLNTLPASAQVFVVTAYQSINVFEGPGITYLQSGRIEADVPFNIIERNSIGTWVHVQRTRDDGSIIYDGWVISGYLNLDASVKFSELPVNTTLPDAVPENGQFALRELYAVPVIPPISDAMHEVYVRGRDELRNYSHVITKVGDSLSADALYLKPMSQSNIVLGAYDYLSETIRYFGTSTSVDSAAARVGMTSYTVLDPAWANSDICEPNETPLDCEFRRKQPSIALIMFGPNDVLHISDVEFDVNMRAIVDHTISSGVIPVLSTFSYDPNMGMWNSAVNFNKRLIQIAADYQVPLINLWLASRALPDYGLDVDHTHMKHWGYDYLKFDDGHVAFSGAALRNLLSIRMLDEIRRTVILDPNAVG